jgi:hypothetical protein
MAFVAIADRDHEHALHDPETFIRKYIWSQDHKVIAIQYALVAIGIGLVALVMSVLMRLQLGFPDTFSLIAPQDYYQYITMHGMIMVIYLLTALFLGGFGNYLIPLMCGSRDMVFPYMNMLSFWFYLLAVLVLVAGLFVPGGPTGAGWTLYPPQAIAPGTPGHGWGIICMLASLAIFVVAFTMGGLNYVTTILQARCKGMTLMRMPLSVWGIFMATVLGLLAFPALFVSCVMMTLDHSLGTSFFMPAVAQMGLQTVHGGGLTAAVPAPVLVLRSSRGVHRGAAGVRHRLRPALDARPPQHLRLPHDGVGDPGDRLPELRRVGAPHVRQRHEPVLRLLLRDHHADHRGADGDQGLQLGADAVEGRHPPDGADAVRDRLHLHLHQRRPHRPVPRQRHRRRAAVGHVLRGRALPHGDGRVADPGGVRRDLSLVSEDHRAAARRPLGRIHFWCTFIGTYSIYLPMHYLGILGVPRRYYAYSDAIDFIGQNVHIANEWISISAVFVAATQLVFLFNLAWSLKAGRPSGPNPWRSTSLEWQTPDTPPKHGNWGKDLPVVYRWAYDYNVPGAPEDFVPQNVPPGDPRAGNCAGGRDHGVHH